MKPLNSGAVTKPLRSASTVVQSAPSSSSDTSSRPISNPGMIVSVVLLRKSAVNSWNSMRSEPSWSTAKKSFAQEPLACFSSFASRRAAMDWSSSRDAPLDAWAPPSIFEFVVSVLALGAAAARASWSRSSSMRRVWRVCRGAFIFVLSVRRTSASWPGRRSISREHRLSGNVDASVSFRVNVGIRNSYEV